jgi:hypothetical protein
MDQKGKRSNRLERTPWKDFQQALAALTSMVAANAVKCWDPDFTKIGDPHDLSTYLPDYGATQHMTTWFIDLHCMVEGKNLGVEVANNHIIKCTTTGKVKISILDNSRKRLEVVLVNMIYVPGLSCWLFSVVICDTMDSARCFEVIPQPCSLERVKCQYH